MNEDALNKLRKMAFSPMTLFRGFRQSQLEDGIRNNPVIFCRLLIESKLRPRQQQELLEFFLRLAIPASRLNEDYRRHLDMLLRNHNYLSLWPNSVGLLRASLLKINYVLPDPALY